MHFPIIAIESLETKKADFEKSLPYDDATFSRYCDYFGELYSLKERKKVIESNWLKNLFEGIATIDTKRETITFLDGETIQKTFKEYLADLVSKLNDKAQKNELSGFDLRCAGTYYKDSDVMFYKGYGQTSFEFFEDAQWYAGETYKIGNIFDGHF